MKKRTLLCLLTVSLLGINLLSSSCGTTDNTETNSTTDAKSSIFFTHFADIHITNDTEVSDVFGGTIPPVTTMEEAVKEVLSYNPEVVVDTGDIVALSDSYDLDTGERWFKLANETVKAPIVSAGIPFLFAPGNHDNAGIRNDSADPTDPRYGTGLIFKYIDTDTDNKTYYSYSKGDYHFIMLDPEEIPETGYRTVTLPEEQLDWLKDDLKENEGKYIIISYHQPLGSWEDESYQNFMDALEPYKDKITIIAGHTHDNRVIYRDGIPEYQDGAPCGDWWQTGKTPDGNPMGYAIYYFENGKINRFYKGIGKTKQINLLSPVDVTLNDTTHTLELNAYYENATITKIGYTIDNGTFTSLNFTKVDTPNIDWYHIKDELKPPVTDDKNHSITFSVQTGDGEYYNSTYVYKFSNNPIMNISEVTNDTNFDYYYGRFVKVNATITNLMYDGNLLTISDSTGSIAVWAGDCKHPEFEIGDQILMRAQVTAYKGTKELKLVSADDVEITGHVNATEMVIPVENISTLYDDEIYGFLEGKRINVKGVVTADFGNLIFIQDNSTRGVASYSSSAFQSIDNLTVGSNISLNGTLTTYYDIVEVNPNNETDIVVNGTAPVPETQVINISEIAPLEGTLVKLENLEVTDVNNSSITVTDGTNNTTIYCGKAGFDPSTFVNPGDTVDVTGIAYIYKENPQILPRSEEDIVVK